MSISNPRNSLLVFAPGGSLHPASGRRRGGGGSHREDLALGTAPNIAARRQALAEPGNVLLSAATAHFVDGFFDYDSLGPRPLNSIS